MNDTPNTTLTSETQREIEDLSANDLENIQSDYVYVDLFGKGYLIDFKKFKMQDSKFKICE